MIDIKAFRKEPERVKAALARRGEVPALDELLRLDVERRQAVTNAELLKSKKNNASREVASLIAQGKNPETLIADVKKFSEKIAQFDDKVGELDAIIANIELNIPNIPHISTPSGRSSDNNVNIKEYGTKGAYSFTPLPHWELGECLRILDFESAARLSGSNFPLYKGAGAQLERALYNFMLDLHVREHGYLEVSPPYLVKRECMVGTGQLPKLEGDMYGCAQDGLFLIPTAEVPLINMHRGRTLDERSLPLSYVAYSPCFRREAGSYGKETRGLIRVHQFDKVELVKFTAPDDSYEALEQMLRHSEAVVKALGLAYRVILLCAGELSFASSKTYDIEVWAPGIGKWLEVASISNCEDFQARRADIRCKKAGGKGTFHPHILNGSGVALARTFLALIEHYQQSDGTVAVPEVLVPYMGGIRQIK